MKFYIKKGVICWNPKGRPGPRDPARKMARAKAESVPVRDQKSLHEAMAKHFLNGRKINHNALIWTEGAFYTVPNSEINKEWL